MEGSTDSSINTTTLENTRKKKGHTKNLMSFCTIFSEDNTTIPTDKEEIQEKTNKQNM